MTDKANEQGWGSTVKAASEQIKSATDAVAEKIRPTVGDAVADGLKTGGDYTKAGIQNTGAALGLQGSKTTTDKAHDDLNKVADDVKGAGKNIKSDLEHGMQDANAKARTNTGSTFDKAAAQGQNAYHSAADQGANLAQNTANKLDTAK
ncbi:hypothetical protein ABBQ32_009140 [Trebouxia sp. C0010 RCD-2024]